MKEFIYLRPADSRAAIGMMASRTAAKFLGGGTNLVDLMRENIERPDELVDVSRLDTKIEVLPSGGLCIGAGAKNTAVAADAAVRERFPVLSNAILHGASGQIRNMASVGGNLMQRTRCYYFYDEAARCNKRQPGSGCDAIEGFNRLHAILGTSASCIATHPSDMCVALAALDAVVHVEGREGARQIAMRDFHRLPGDTPWVETALRHDELITAVEIAPLPFAKHSVYRKVRDRSSYAFALVSVAAMLDVDDGVVRDVRLALGGVSHKPWRALAAEDALRGQPASEASFARGAEKELAAAVGFAHNGFKIELAKRVIVGALNELVAQGKAAS